MTFYNVPDFPGVPPVPRDPQAAIKGAISNQIPSFVSPALGAARDLAGSVTGQLTDLLSVGDDLGFGAGDAGTAAPMWGLFDADGAQALQPDTFLGIEFRNSSRLSDYPLEQGAFESYNKVANPFDLVVGMAIGGSEAARADFLARLRAMEDDLNLYTLVTPEEVFESVNLERYDYARKQHNGATLLTVNLYLKEIRINLKSEYVTSPEGAPTTAEAAAATTAETNASAPGAPLQAADVQNPASASPESLGQVQAAPATAAQAAPALDPETVNANRRAEAVAAAQGPSASSGALKALPSGYTQDPQTGLIRSPSGDVDRELTIKQGSTYIGPGPGKG